MSNSFTLTTLITRKQHGSDIVAVVAGEFRTRDQFLCRVGAWANTFEARPEKNIALFSEDTYEFAAALLGAWQADKTVVLPGDMQAQTEIQLQSKINCFAGSMPNAIRPIFDCDSNRSFKILDPLVHRLVVQTSGSNGQPLAIDKLVHQLNAEIQTLENTFSDRLDKKLLIYSTVSHQHIYGLLFQVLWPLCAGRVIASGRLEYPEKIIEELSRKPCVLIATPAHLKRLPDTLPWRRIQPFCCAIFSSGGPLSQDASNNVYELTGISPVEVYGSSETGGIAWRQREIHNHFWIPFTAVKLVAIDGLMVVSSPNLPDEKPWLTSDRICIHEDGHVELLGRADRIVKLEEKRVSLSMLENALLDCLEVAEVKVFPMEQAGNLRLATVVVPSELGWALQAAKGRKGLIEKLRLSLITVVDRVAVPRRWRFVQTMPINVQGKTTMDLLTALFIPDRPKVRWGHTSVRSAQACLEIIPELSVFDGHFPDFPVLPGVAQLDWAISFGTEKFDIKNKFLRVDALKFQVPIRPSVEVRLELQYDDINNVMGFAYYSGQVRHSSGRVVFELDSLNA